VPLEESALNVVDMPIPPRDRGELVIVNPSHRIGLCGQHVEPGITADRGADDLELIEQVRGNLRVK
jgi:hypothetical protein